MRILAIADRNPQINLVETVQNEHIDLIITLGDLTSGDLVGLEQITHIPKIGVYGNHDSGNYMSNLGIMDMNLATWDYQGLKFGGFQGCVRYKENPYAIMYTQAEANALLANFPPVDVMLTHCPPRGINDEDEIAHQGFDALRDYLDRCRPKMLLHGHTYPNERQLIKDYNGTRIEYVYRYKIIEL